MFGGSGSTLISCEKNNRIARLIELEPQWCDVIVQRYVNFCTKNSIDIDIKLNGQKFDYELLDQNTPKV